MEHPPSAMHPTPASGPTDQQKAEQKKAEQQKKESQEAYEATPASRPSEPDAPVVGEIASLSAACNVAEPKVFFPVGSARLDAASMQTLDRIAECAKSGTLAERSLRLSGYADPTGSPAGNQRLSAQRAQAVANYLVQKGVTRDRIDVAAEGAIAPAAIEGGYDQARRVDIDLAPED